MKIKTNRAIFTIISILIMLSFVTASNPLDIEIDTHYYRQGEEVKFFYIQNVSYDAISFDIIGTNIYSSLFFNAKATS